jgi:hypothetical protein
MRSHLKFVVLISVTLLLAACSSTVAATDASLAPASAANLDTWALPLDDYIIPPQNIIVADYAENLLVHDCMVSRGHVWDIPAINMDSLTVPTRSASGRRLFNSAVAAQFGYHEPAVYSKEVRDAMSALNSRQLTAVEQSDFGSCLEKARVTLPLANDSQLGARLANAALDTASADGAVVAASGRWRECMKPAGIPDLPVMPEGDSPTTMPTESERGQFGLGDPYSATSTGEIQIAKMDADCRISSGFSQALYQAEFTAQTLALKKNADALVRDRDAFTSHQTAAMAVIASEAGK